MLGYIDRRARKNKKEGKRGRKKIAFGNKKEKRGRFQKKKQGGRKKGARKTRDFS